MSPIVAHVFVMPCANLYSIDDCQYPNIFGFISAFADTLASRSCFIRFTFETYETKDGYK